MKSLPAFIHPHAPQDFKHTQLMIHALLAEPEPSALENLRHHLHTYCPQVEVQGHAHSRDEVYQLIQNKHPDLLFIEKGLAHETQPYLDTHLTGCPTTIVLVGDCVYSRPLPVLQAVSYLTRPLQIDALLAAVGQAQQWIQLRQEQSRQKQMLARMLRCFCPNNVIAIPTLEGVEFFHAEEIIRCEGLQKYTLIVTREGKDLVSSQNIGEFGKLLLAHGFFATHKSHLVNLRYIRKLSNEGDISLRDGSHVPLSRRRRRAFLDEIRHLS